MYKLIKRLLFLLPAEKAHHFTLRLLQVLFRLPLGKPLFKSLFSFHDKKLERTVFGLKFKNPVGLAAGFDKNGDFIPQFAAMGFGFLEVGTVTPKPQPGNPPPRLFRLPPDEALINRMGFNNKGVDHLYHRLLKKRPSGLIIGGNIGKNKVTPNESAAADYVQCFHVLYPVVDYFVVNVSSPNTPDLRQLQEREPLTRLLQTLQEENRKMSQLKPILLKIAPDLNRDQLRNILDIVRSQQISGLIATNTTIRREGLQTDVTDIGDGGLSGRPLLRDSTEIIRYLRTLDKSIPIVAVGGIMDAKGALLKLRAGADLVQVYTGLVYRGPALVKEINKAIAAGNSST